MRRPTFLVNSVSQLLSPMLYNYNLKFSLDICGKQEVLNLLSYIDTSTNGSFPNRHLLIESIEVPSQAWYEGVKAHPKGR
jgi:hypothetical protein